MIRTTAKLVLQSTRHPNAMLRDESVAPDDEHRYEPRRYHESMISPSTLNEGTNELKIEDQSLPAPLAQQLPMAQPLPLPRQKSSAIDTNLHVVREKKTQAAGLRT
jgi:hypothetical protein